MIKELGFWALDYVYALKWQILAFNHPQPPATHSPGSGKSPVILIPGVYEPWLFMKPVADQIQNGGHTIYFVEELGYHTMKITDAAQAVRRLIDRYRLTNAIIVAHSKGGLVGKYVLSHLNYDRAVARLIAVATPFSGSTYARWWLIETIYTFSPRHPDITQLQAQTAVNPQIVSIYGRFDPHIPSGSYLQGATNLQLPAVGHFRILDLPVVKNTIMAHLQPPAGP